MFWGVEERWGEQGTWGQDDWQLRTTGLTSSSPVWSFIPAVNSLPSLGTFLLSEIVQKQPAKQHSALGFLTWFCENVILSRGTEHLIWVEGGVGS